MGGLLGDDFLISSIKTTRFYIFICGFRNMLFLCFEKLGLVLVFTFGFNEIGLVLKPKRSKTLWN